MSTSQTVNPTSQPGGLPPDWPSRILLRPAEESDLIGMEWEGEFTRYRRNYAEAYTRSKRGLSLIWLLDLPGVGLVGQVLVQLKMDDRSYANGRTRAYIHSFRVREGLRGYGLGTRLMAHAEKDLAERGFHEVTLNVAEENEGALRLYKRLGYRILKKIPGRWSYFDEKGVLRHVTEPGFQLIKRLRQLTERA